MFIPPKTCFAEFVFDVADDICFGLHKFVFFSSKPAKMTSLRLISVKNRNLVPNS